MGNRHGRLIVIARAVFCVAACVGVGFASAAISSRDSWYDSLRKPSWMPPGWLFPIVWTVLYAMMGVALAAVLDRGWTTPDVRRATILFSTQLALNFAWSPTFFRLHSIAGAMAIIVVLWLFIAWTAAAFWSVRDVAGALLLPYWAWVTFAVALNAAIWRLN